MIGFRHLAAAGFAAAISLASAHATTFVFKGHGNNVTPLGVSGVDFQENCASPGDFCSFNHASGLDYQRDSIDLKVIAYAGGDGDDKGSATRLIQDIHPGDSGLGAYSENNTSADQTEADTGESIEFIFGAEYWLNNVEFNAGGDRDCTKASDGSGEGSCGAFRLRVFNLADILVLDTVIDITNIDVLATLGYGARFLLSALTPGSGFTVAQFTVNEVPLPAALPLLLAGIAGLRFASRRAK